MAKKRKSKKLDEFIDAKKQSQESALEQQTRLSNRVFRYCVALVVVLLLVALVDPPTISSVLGLSMLFGLMISIGSFATGRLCPSIFPGAGSFNQFVAITLATIFTYKLSLEFHWSPYLSPIPFAAMLLGLAIPQIAAMIVTVALSFYLAMLHPPAEHLVEVAFDAIYRRIDFPLAVAFAVGGVVAVLGVARIRQQSRPMLVGLYCGLIQAVTSAGFLLLREDFAERQVEPEFWTGTLWALSSGVIAGAILTSLLPLIEVMLGVVTERRLLQLADPSNKLLRVLRERAPGTFQHTLGVQQLARNAAEAISADVLLTEVGAYYHDIGKIFKPDYFVENMGEDRSIHDRLRPSMSKMIIISHVKDGIVLAKEEKLPKRVIDMIPMHHGTTVVEFFFRKARKESEDVDEEPVEDVNYRYPGPKPAFAEAGILMLADAVEAIAKSMQDPTSNRLRDMVRSVIMKRLEDGQLDECSLTISDLRRIEDSFVRTLTNMYHERIDYDKSDGGGDATSSGSHTLTSNVAAGNGNGSTGNGKESESARAKLEDSARDVKAS